MHIIKRFIVILLCGITLTGFFGCSNSRNTSESNNTEDEDISEQTPDLKGQIIVVGVRNEMDIPGGQVYTTGSNPAVYRVGQAYDEIRMKRKVEVEKKYNCIIKWKTIDTKLSREIAASMKAGEHPADILFIQSSMGFPALVSNNLLISLDNFIDFKNGYYGSRSKTSCFNGKYYGINITDNPGFGTLYYNKSLVESIGCKDPIKSMKDGQWTWDAFLEIVTKATTDTNGDGEIDRWGLIDCDYSSIINGFLISNEANFTKQNENQTVYTLGESTARQSLQFVWDLYNTHKVMRNYSIIGQNKYLAKLFEQSRGTFIDYFSDTGNMEFECRKILYPKGPNASDNVVYAAYGTGSISIPATTDKPEVIAKVMSDLFSYFDETRKEYFVKDESKNVLSEDEKYIENLLLENKKYTLLTGMPETMNIVNMFYEKLVIEKASVDDVLNEDLRKQVEGLAEEKLSID